MGRRAGRPALSRQRIRQRHLHRSLDLYTRRARLRPLHRHRQSAKEAPGTLQDGPRDYCGDLVAGDSVRFASGDCIGSYHNERHQVLQSFRHLRANLQQVKHLRLENCHYVSRDILIRYVTVIKATIYYFLPLTIIGILYTLMAKKLQHSAREVQSIAGAGYQLKNPQAQNRRHVARMVMVFILGLLLQLKGSIIESKLCFYCLQSSSSASYRTGSFSFGFGSTKTPNWTTI